MTRSPRTKRTIEAAINDLEETFDAAGEEVPTIIDYGDVLRYSYHLLDQGETAQSVEEFFGQPVKLSPRLALLAEHSKIPECPSDRNNKPS